MKTDPRLADMPVIFVSALGQTHNETEGFDCGAVDYIAKPISPSIVLARGRHASGAARGLRALAAAQRRRSKRSSSCEPANSR